MSLHYKMIIPLLGPEITKEDLEASNGFCGAFSYDINRPYLDNHIMLLYDTRCTTDNIDRFRRFKKCATFYSRITVKIKGFSFLCYTFSITNKSIRSIKSDKFLIDDNDLLRIYKFWRFSDDDINHFMIHGKDIFSETFECSVIPEWDYDG